MHDLFLALADACKDDLNTFTAKAFNILEPGRPFQSNWHIDCISEHLQAQFEGEKELQHLIINEPPRTLKSVQVGQIYPAWCMMQDPSFQVIGAAYAHSLAERNVTKARQLLQSDFYLEAYPDTVISADNNRKDYFTTTKNGQYKGTGIGGTITGFGCDLLVIDDPLNPKESVSDTIRVTTNDEIRSTLFSRYNDYLNGMLAMIMQRLHEDDPTGNLLADGGYYHLKLPAYAKTSVHIDLRGKHWRMEAGDYLTPRLNEEALDKLKQSLGEYHYAGQYMQEPVPAGGGDFKEEWPQYYLPGGAKPREMNVVILCDPAGGEELNKKKRKLSDWTAFVVVGLAPDNNYYVLDIVRDKLNPTDRVETLFMLHRKWNELCGKPPKVGYEKYGMMTDTHYIKQKMSLDGYNFGLVELGGTMSKEERIRRMIPDLQNSRWFFPSNLTYIDMDGRKFDLIQELVKGEMASFPKAKNDDMLDALSRVYEDNLHLVFPKQRANMVQRASKQNHNVQSWEDF